MPTSHRHLPHLRIKIDEFQTPDYNRRHFTLTDAMVVLGYGLESLADNEQVPNPLYIRRLATEMATIANTIDAAAYTPFSQGQYSLAQQIAGAALSGMQKELAEGLSLLTAAYETKALDNTDELTMAIRAATFSMPFSVTREEIDAAKVQYFSGIGTDGLRREATDLKKPPQIQ